MPDPIPRKSADLNPDYSKTNYESKPAIADPACCSQPGDLEREDIRKDRIEAERMDVAPDANRDPITDAPGSHPIGVGVGAAAAGAAGAAMGSVVGPVGTAVGAAIGAVVGGLAGKGVAEAVNPTEEDAYWRDNYSNRPYYSSNYDYESDYGPAYRYGWESRSRHGNKKWGEVESHLSRDWDRVKGESKLSWDKAKHATRDAWDRVEDKVSRNQPGETSSKTDQPYPASEPHDHLK